MVRRNAAGAQKGVSVNVREGKMYPRQYPFETLIPLDYFGLPAHRTARRGQRSMLAGSLTARARSVDFVREWHWIS